MPSIEVDGARLSYVSSGASDRPWVTLGHSLGADSTYWDSFAEYLAPDFRVLRYDTRGHGDSVANHSDFTLERLGQDVVDLWNALGIERSHFVGLSLGGMIGMELGVNHPSRIHKLVLCGSLPQSTDAYRNLWNRRVDVVNEKGIDVIVDEAMARWFTPPFYQTHPEVVSRVREILAGTSVNGYVGCGKAIRNIAYLSRLNTIKAPTMALSGSEDAVAQMVQAAAREIPGAVYAEIPNASHIVNLEQPDAFNRTVAEFLKK